MSTGRAAWAVAGATVAFAAALGSRGLVNVWLATGLAASISIALALCAARQHLLSLLRPRAADVVAGVLAGGALAGATHAGYRGLVALLPELPALVAPLYRDLGQSPGPILVLPLLVWVTFAEELVWRGLAVDILSRRFSPLSTGALATLAYALPLVASCSAVLVALGLTCGAVWTTLRSTTGGLLAPWLCHAVWGGLVLALWPLPPG